MKSKRSFGAIKVAAKGLILLALATFLSNPALAQPSSNRQNSGPFKFENGVRKARFLVINFKNKVFDLPQGKKSAEVNDMQTAYGTVRMHFEQLEARYGKLNFYKQIPDAVWGDVLRQNRKTGKLVQLHEWSQYFYVSFPDFVPIDSLIATMKELPEVDYVRAPVIAVPQITPIDPEFNSPTGQWNLVKIDAENAWNISRGSSNVVVAVIEAASLLGAEKGLPFFANPDFWTGDGGTSGTSKFAPGGHTGAPGPHATGVAGIVAAATNDTDGIASLGWNIRMRPYKFNESRVPDFGDAGLAAAIELAITEGTDVINFSFVVETNETFPGVDDCFGTACVFRELAGVDDMEDTNNAIRDAKAMDIIMVAAAGNDIHGWVFSGGTTCDPCLELGAQPAYPALNANVLAITATDSNDDAVTDYNFGNFIDFAAPGIQVRSTLGNAIANWSGTSFSSPLVASLAGLVKSINPMITQTDFENILIATSEDVNQAQYPGKDVYLGHGRINAYEALKYTLENYGGTLSGEVTLTENLDIQPGNTLTIEAGATVRFQGASTNLVVRQGAKLVAVGTPSQPILFTSADANPERKSWRHVWLYGSNNHLEHCTFEYGNIFYIYGYPTASTGNIVRNCTFREFDHGLHIQNSTVTVENCNIKDNRHAFVIQNNATVTIDGATVRNNDRDGIYTGGSVVDVFNSLFEFNGEGDFISFHGIYAIGGSDVYLGDRSYIPIPHEDQVAGFNTIRDNHGAGIYVSSQAGTKVTAGIFSFPLYSAGQNSLHGNGTKPGTLYTGKDFYNKRLTTMNAQNNYWGGNCPPNSSQIYGNVTTSNCLGSPPGAMALRYDLSALENTGRINTVTAAGQNTFDDTQFKKDLIVEYKRVITEQPDSPQAVAAVQNYYSLVRTDRENKLQERSIVLGYLNGNYTTNKNLELGKTALQLMILEARRMQDLTTAISLSEEALTQLSGEAKAGVIFNLVFTYIQADEFKKAEEAVATFKKEFPKNDAEIELLEGSLQNALQQVATQNLKSSSLSNLETQTLQPTAPPEGFRLFHNYPNPFNPETRMQYQLSEASKVQIKIFNVAGQLVRSFEAGVQPADVHSVVWDSKDNLGQQVSSGIYIYQLTAEPLSGNGERFEMSRKFTLVR